MDMGNIIVGLVLVAVVALAVRSCVRRIRYGSSCCGTREPEEKKVRVKDKKKEHYPYNYHMKVDGMHCSNCARRVENALNKTEGRWATADVGKKEVLLLSKQEEREEELGRTIASAGYTMLSCERGL